MQHTAWPGNMSVYGSRNLPCSPACTHQVDLIPSPAQVGSAEPWHGLSNFSSDPEWAHKHLGPQMPFEYSIARVHIGSMAQKAAFQNNKVFFPAITESVRPLLKEPQHATSDKAYLEKKKKMK